MMTVHEAANADWRHLPFVHIEEGAPSDNARIEYWRTRSTGDYGADCTTGVQYADLLMRHVRETQNMPLACRVLAAAHAEPQTGISAGFISKILRQAATAAEL